MNARVALNVALLAAAAGLAWLAVDGNRDAQPPPGLVVSTLTPSEVTRIGIEPRGKPAVVLERIGQQWHLASPMALPADGFRVQTLLALTQARSDTGFRASGNDLAQFGLDPPEARLRFDDVEVDVGGTETVSGRRYLMSDDQVHLVEDRWFSPIFGEPAAWVDPQPLPGGLKPLRIALPGLQWRLENGSWKRTPPDERASADAGTALAQAWQRSRALAVRARDPALAWDQRVEVEVQATDLPARVIVFEVARTGDSLLLARPDLRIQYRFLARQGRLLLGQ